MMHGMVQLASHFRKVGVKCEDLLAPFGLRFSVMTENKPQRYEILTYWGRDWTAFIFQTTFSNTFSQMKMYEFRLQCLWSLSLRVHLAIFQRWLRYWLGTDQATSHYQNQRWLDYWRIYASLDLNELKVVNQMPVLDCINSQHHYQCNVRK